MQGNVLTIEQRQILSENQVQSLAILSYSNQALEAFLVNEYLDNPLLDNTLDKQDEMMKDLEHMYEKSTSYEEHYKQWGEDDAARSNDIRDTDSNGLRDLILSQLDKRKLNHEEWTIINYLILCLDESGFFPYEINEIADAIKLPHTIVANCLNTLKNLEPVGIFSRNISECLKKQLDAKGIYDKKLLIMVEDYFQDIIKGNISTISRKLNLKTSKVREYIHIIGSLNPKPVMSIKTEKTQFIIPDIIATFEKNEWNVKINDNWMGEYKFNDYYIRMMNSSDDVELREYFKIKLDRAKLIINSVEQRRKTIIKVVEAILETQEGYFKYADELSPMRMEDIALKTDMHISTVSRAIKDKYLQFNKTVKIKDLFVAAATSDEEMSTDMVKNRLCEIIAQENKEKPLSDLKISDLMKTYGIDISRRTVAKYRGQLNIPDSRLRLYL